MAQAGGLCRPEAAASLVGKPRVTDAQAMQLTGATIVRQIKPGDAVTMDFRQERVTVETDAGTGKITRAMCRRSFIEIDQRDAEFRPFAAA